VTDEAKLRADRDRGARAKALLEDKLLIEAFTELDAQYMAAWRSSPALDTQAREKLHLAVNVLAKVREHLTTVAASGKLAVKELEQLTAEAERKKRFRIV
jgi:predicted hotdog family 3-hydroxylacyl-ACP dehydratase